MIVYCENFACEYFDKKKRVCTADEIKLDASLTCITATAEPDFDEEREVE